MDCRTTAAARRLACLALLAGAVAGCEVTQSSSTGVPGAARGEALRLIDEAQRHAEKGRTDDAIEAYRASINASPNISTAWNNLGELYLRQERYADAVSAFETAGDLQPTDPRPIYNAGVAYQQAGWAEDAYDQFSRALERDGNYLPALRGAIRSADMLTRTNLEVQEWLQRASMLETEPAWREYFERQRFRVEAGLEDQAGTRAG